MWYQKKNKKIAPLYTYDLHAIFIGDRRFGVIPLFSAGVDVNPYTPYKS